MEIDKIKEELMNLEKDILVAKDGEVSIIQEEIIRLKKEIRKMEDISLVEEQELIKEARYMTGEANRSALPQAKIITINNVSKEIEVDGRLVTPRPEQTFICQEKDVATEEWKISENFGPVLKGVILAVRYQVISKHKVEPAYKSFEFGDTRRDNIRIFTGTYKQPQYIFTGSYDAVKQAFATKEIDSMGNFKKSFDLFAFVYMEVNDKLYKFKTKLTMGNGLFNYLGSFGENETYLAIQTVLNLEWQEVSASVKFWQAKYSRGERHGNLKKYLEMFKELQDLFIFIDNKSNNNKANKQQFATNTNKDNYDPSVPIGIEDFTEKPTKEISVDEIPF